MSGRMPPVHNQRRGRVAERRRDTHRKHNEKRRADERDSDAGTAQTHSHTRARKSYTKAAVDKREYRAAAASNAERERVHALEAELEQLRKDGTRKQLIEAAKHEENLEAVLAALERAQEQLESQQQLQAKPLDFRLPSGEYSCAFARLCAKVLGHGTPAAYAGDVIRDVAEFVSQRQVASVPCQKTLGEIVRTAGIVAEAVVAKALHEHAAAESPAIAAVHIDETTKNGVSLHGESVTLPAGTFSYGVSACASKSAQDQLAASKRLRADVMEAGAAVFGLPREDPLLHTGALVSDSGATEEVIRVGLEQQRQELQEQKRVSDSEEKQSTDTDAEMDTEEDADSKANTECASESGTETDTDSENETESDAESQANTDGEVDAETDSEAENGKDEKREEDKEEKETKAKQKLAADVLEIIIKLICHKHKLSNVTKATEQNGMKACTNGESALDALYLAQKMLRKTSRYGHAKGTELEALCESEHEPNDISHMGPHKGTRHHLRFADLPWLALAADLIIKFISKVATKSKGGKKDASRRKANKNFT